MERFDSPAKKIICPLGTATCVLHYFESKAVGRVIPLELEPNASYWLFCLENVVFWDGLVVSAGRHCIYKFGNQPLDSHLTMHGNVAALLIQIPNGPWLESGLIPTRKALEIGPRLAYHLQSILQECNAPSNSAAKLSYQLRSLMAGASAAIDSVRIRYSFQELQNIKKVEADLLSFGASIRSVQNLSNMLGIKSYKLKLLIRSIFSCSAQQWLLSLKMTYATQLLLQKEISIRHIAMQLQYHSDDNFITAFKGHFGITPHVFRKQVSQLHANLFFEIH